VGLRGLSAAAGTVTRMIGPRRELHRFELEPEVREWLDGLSDSDYKRVDEVAGLLAERARESAGRGTIVIPALAGGDAEHGGQARHLR
jgi:hypothetical protein